MSETKPLSEYRPAGRKRPKIVHPQLPIKDLSLARLIGGQAKRGRIWAVVWTPGNARICLTKVDAEFAQRVWKEWKRAHGWKVMGPIARKGAQVEACVVHGYDAETFARLD